MRCFHRRCAAVLLSLALVGPALAAAPADGLLLADGKQARVPVVIPGGWFSPRASAAVGQ